MLKEFKKFIMRGNMIDLAVGMIIGTAFNGLVSSLVNDIFMPVIGCVIGDTNFTDFFVILGRPDSAALVEAGYAADFVPTVLADAKALGFATLNYGNFITGLIHFLIMAIIVFFMVKVMNKIAEAGKKPEAPAEPAAPTTKVCPYCKSEISIEATRCAHCTSEL